MKKRIKYLLLIIMLVAIDITVKAESFFNDKVYNVCGIDKFPQQLPKFTSGLYNTIKILVPIVLIVMGLVDFLGAMMAQDEQKMKKNQKKFITRLIAGIMVFFVMAITQFIFNKISFDKRTKHGFSTCMSCLLSNKNCGDHVDSSTLTCAQRGKDSCLNGTDSEGHRCRLNGQTCVIDCESISSRLACEENKNSCGNWKQTSSTTGTCPNK